MRNSKNVFEIVEFPSEGVLLRGRLYLPQNMNKPSPIVIMAHGFSATIAGMTADKYAESFFDDGFAVLLFDHKSFGISEGEPRYEINLWVQARGYINAIDYVTKLSEVDNSKIAIWGDSNSASLSIMVSSIDSRVKAVLVQVPACGSTPPPEDMDGSKFNEIKEMLLNSDLTARESVNGPMPVVSSDQINNPSALEPITAFRWFIEYGGRFESKWKNQVTIVNPNPSIIYHAGLCGPHIKVPVLMVVSANDEMNGAEPEISRIVYDSIQGPKEWYEIDGGHFGMIYYPSPIFDESSNVQRDFLKKYLN